MNGVNREIAAREIVKRMRRDGYVCSTMQLVAIRFARSSVDLSLATGKFAFNNKSKIVEGDLYNSCSIVASNHMRIKDGICSMCRWHM